MPDRDRVAFGVGVEITSLVESFAKACRLEGTAVVIPSSLRTPYGNLEL